MPMSKSPTLLLFVFYSIVFSFCNYRGEKKPVSKNIQKEWLSRAQNLSDNFPDRVILLVDSIARHVDQVHLLPANYLKLLQLKQTAFTKLKLTDSACITGERIREVASQIPDSLDMAETLIALYTPV